MQIYLFQNGRQEGPFGLPRIVARLVSGELDSATPAWREGLDNWYPLYHDVWKQAGINAPAPKEQPPAPEPVAEAEPEPGPEPQAGEPRAEHAEEEAPGAGEADLPEVGEPDATAGEPAPEEPATEPSGEPFADYREEDFKPPSYQQMEEEMAELRAKRETFPRLIGQRAFEAELLDEEIDEVREKIRNLKSTGKEDELPAAYAELGRAVMAAGITDPALDDLRDEEQEVSDRMLNLQMQLRRMGGGNRVKQPSPWRKWIVLLVVALVLGGLITALVLFGNS